MISSKCVILPLFIMLATSSSPMINTLAFHFPNLSITNCRSHRGRNNEISNHEGVFCSAGRLHERRCHKRKSLIHSNEVCLFQSNPSNDSQDAIQNPQQQQQQNQRNNPNPTELFNLDIERVTESAGPNAAQRSEEMLNHMEDLYRSGSRTVRPNIRTFIIVIDAYARAAADGCGKKGAAKEAADKAYELHRRMLALLKELGEETSPSVESDSEMEAMTRSYNALLNVFAKSSGCLGDYYGPRKVNSYSSARRAELTLDEMVARSKPNDGNDQCVKPKPNTESYGLVIEAWARNLEKFAPQKAEIWLKRMEEMNASGDYHAKPDSQCYNAVIKALTKSKESGSTRKADDVLRRMHDLYRDGNADLRPRLDAYGLVIIGWSKSREKGAAKSASDLLQQALSLYKEERPGNAEILLISFNAVIGAWGRTSGFNGANNAEALLRQMQQLSEAGYTDLTPDVITYNSVINSFCKSNQEGGIAKCELLLEEMDKLHEQGSVDVQPDVITFSTIINAWAKSKKNGAAQRAEKLLQEMGKRYRLGDKTLKPNVINYTAVINAWTKSRERRSAQKAEELLEKMQAQYNEGNADVKPDVICYSSVIDSWAKSNENDAVQRAENLLQQMEDLYQAGDESMMPNVRTYTSVMLAISKSREKGMAKKAKSILDHMKQLCETGHADVKPNIFTFNYLLNACANSSGDAAEQSEALSIAICTFREILKSQEETQDSFTYAFFIKACSNLMPRSEKRIDVAKQSFHLCCRDGQVSEEVIYRLQCACPVDVFREQLGDVWENGQVAVNRLPREWTCNVRRR